MTFSDPRFFLFLAGTLLLLGVIPGNNSRKRFLALASCFFYAAWDWRYLGLLLAVSVKDYYLAARVAGALSPRSRKVWLLASIVSSLGILAYFKYCNFFLDNLFAVVPGLRASVPLLDILLPAGISFYTFKTMSYAIDVYRGELKLCRSLIDYTTFVTFFPELIAGPIVRGSIFLPQLSRNIGPTAEQLRVGLCMFSLGLVKKMLIADRMAQVADTVFSHPEYFSTATVWCGVIAYTLQIYCDFSGYSDMAIGVARMIGYDLPENFRMPYLSLSITDFWRRWHMTLSSWLKDYLYIPLGGNRGGALFSYRNLMLTMLLGGLWHGASWNFVIWGGLHGMGLVGHKLWNKHSGMRLPMVLAWVLTLLFVMVCWVPFRCQSFESTWVVWKAMLGVSCGSYQWINIWVPRAVVFCVAGHLIGWLIEKSGSNLIWRGIVPKITNISGLGVQADTITGSYVVVQRITVLGAYLAAFMLLLLFFFSPLSNNPFIYFQF